jgi:hypothetical protein
MGMITTDQLALYSGIKSADSNRLALMEIYIGAAEQAVRDYLGFDPQNQDYVHMLDGDGSRSLQLRAWPVESIASIVRQGESIDPAGVNIDREFLRYLDGTTWPNAPLSVVVTYTAGWSSSEMPAAIKLAVLQIAALKYTEEGGNLAVTSKSFGDAGTRTFQNSTNLEKFLEKLEGLRLTRF